MAFAVTVIALASLMFILVQVWRKMSMCMRKLPPGPLGFPIFGSLHLLAKFPHRALQKLSKTYGPIMHLRLGQVPTIVVSSPQFAESFLKTHDLEFANRPSFTAAGYLTYNMKNMSGSPYGSYWRNVRKMSTIHLLTNQKIDSFRPMRKEELTLLMNYIKEASCQGITIDLTSKITSLSADMTCRFVFGKKYAEKEFDDTGFMSVMKRFLKAVSTPYLGDFFPFLAPFDIQGLTKKIKPVSQVFDGFLEKIIDEHIQSKDDHNQTKDFADIMLEYMGSEEGECVIGRDNIKALMLDVLLGSMDTTALTIDWALSEIMRHPRVMNKLQKELEEKIGMNRIVEESDLGNFEYLDMVIKETLRLHPIAPLLMPHKAGQDTIVDGFLIPKDSLIFINAWAIGRDPVVWSDAEKFWPERFIGSNIGLEGRNFELIPFGSGRRGCPGIQLGMTVVRLVVAQLMHCFDWKLPNDMLHTDLDMTEEMGLVMARAMHLQAIPSYRLQI